jgi:hypothetical protein
MTTLTLNMTLSGATDATAPTLSALLAATCRRDRLDSCGRHDRSGWRLFYVVTQNATETRGDD